MIGLKLKKTITTKILLSLVSLLFLASCSKTPKCNDEEVKKKVIATFKKNVSDEIQEEYKSALEGHTEYVRLLPILKNTNKYIDDLEIKLSETISTEIKEDIKKCNCEASFNTVEKNPISKKDIKDFLAGNDILNYEYSIENFVPTIKYSAQVTDDKKLKIVIDNVEDLEIIENNVAAKVLRDIYREMKKIKTTARRPSVVEPQINTTSMDNETEVGNEYVSDSWYNINASAYSPVFFYNSPNESDRRNARFTTNERVFVQEINNGFGYITFTNSNGQTSKGWIKLVNLYQ